jgi:hypothetical protein
MGHGDEGSADTVVEVDQIPENPRVGGANPSLGTILPAIVALARPAQGYGRRAAEFHGGAGGMPGLNTQR